MIVWTIDRIIMNPSAALAELLAHEKRVSDLLEANNRYQQEARDARTELKSERMNSATFRANIVDRVRECEGRMELVEQSLGSAAA